MSGPGDRSYFTMPGAERELMISRDGNEATDIQTMQTPDTRRCSDGLVQRASWPANFTLIGVGLTLKCVRDPQDVQGAEDFFR
jgi:hypothetical protein